MEVDPLYLIGKSFGTFFKFHSNLLLKSNKTKFFPSFYREIILNWKKHVMAEIPSCILSQYLWYNKSVWVVKASVNFLTFSEKMINYVSQLFSDNGSIKNYMNLRENKTYLKVHILIATISRLYSRKMEIYYQKNYENAINLILHDHHLTKGSRVVTLDKLTSTEIYSILISKV